MAESVRVTVPPANPCGTSEIEEVLRRVSDDVRAPTELEYYASHSRRYLETLKLICAAAPLGSRILDVGCYPYQIAAALKWLGYDVSGLTGHHDPIDARFHTRANDLEKEAIPFDDAEFDLVLFTEVIEHLVQSPVPALREMRRVAKPGGVLITTTRNIAVLGNRLRLLRGRSVMWGIGVYLQNDGRGGELRHRHHREYTHNELAEVIRASGWNVTKAGHFTGVHTRFAQSGPAAGLATVLVDAIKRARPSLADTVYVVGQRPVVSEFPR